MHHQSTPNTGEHSSISRKHAIIRYNFTKGVWCGKVNQHNRIDYPSSTGAFELEVLSKNGVTIEGTLHTPDSGPVALHSQDTITVSDQSFVFLLPKDVRRCGTCAASCCLLFIHIILHTTLFQQRPCTCRCTGQSEKVRHSVSGIPSTN